MLLYRESAEAARVRLLVLSSALVERVRLADEYGITAHNTRELREACEALAAEIERQTDNQARQV